MEYLRRQKSFCKKVLGFLVIMTMVFSSLGVAFPNITDGIVYGQEWVPSVEQPILIVTGEGLGLTNEKSYTLDELNTMEQSTNLYSTINTTPTKSIYLGKGVKVNDLLHKSGLEQDNYNQYKISFVAMDGYKVTFDPDHVGDSTTSKKLISPGYGLERYYYPGLNSDQDSGKSPVDTILAFERAGNRGEAHVIPQESDLEKLSNEDAPLLMVGQQHIKEQNNPLFNKTINKIIVGEEIQPILKIGSKNYTRADVLLMPRVKGEWTYTKKVGSVTDYCVGVPLSSLLEGYEDNHQVEFISADGYTNSPVMMADIKDSSNEYILAYETGTDSNDVTAVYDIAKDDSSIEGYFRVYSQDGSLIKLVNEIRITAPENEVSTSESPYKHITNGGQPGDAPYGVDAITGATLTFEGPGLEASIPLSIKEMENQDGGVHRGEYEDIRDGVKKTFLYEGIRLEYLLKNMTSGITGINLTDTAHKVLLKNRVRQTIAEFTLSQVAEAEENGKPIIIAYGTSERDGSNPRPFVYDAGAGADSKLGNEDGCIKLVYDKTVFNIDPNPEYNEFGNVAYIYVAENDSPGYKHDKPPYDSQENSQYIITITGDKMGREVNYTVQQIEDMVEYTSEGQPVADGMGFRKEYSLANSTYWYVNEYEGVKLWDLLKKSGIPESMAKGKDSDTLVQFTATDGYKDFDKFTIKQIADPSLFCYYEKNPADLNDGEYVSNDADDLRYKGYPVLVAYGVNGYPYVIKNTLDGYKSGLGNDGGPLRIISGKTEYHHANGSKQAKLLDKIVVGNEVNYSTHLGNPNEIYNELAANTIEIKVIGMDGSTIKEENLSVADIENMIYGAQVSNSERTKARLKNFYGIEKGDAVYSDLYEGVSLNYLLKEKVQIPGTKGTVEFKGSDDSIVVSLDEIFTKPSILAFAKNGAPMVADKNSLGYESSYTDGQGEKVNVKNNGGPLMIIVPKTEDVEGDESKSISNIASITVNLQPDRYAHLEEPYKGLGENEIVIEGPGTKLGSSRIFKVSELEGKQTLVVTGDYNMKNDSSEEQLRYRGLDLYGFLRSVDVGLQSNASEVVFTARDGKSLTFSLEDIMKSDYINGATSSSNLKMILAYGSSFVENNDVNDGKPLVGTEDAKGYDAQYKNSGGPIALVVGQTSADDVNAHKVLEDVVSIKVNASETTSWKHSMSPTYGQYLEDTLEISGTALESPKTFTLSELEAMDDIIIRDSYTYIGEHQHEGLDLWKLITLKAGLKPNTELTAVKVVASDGFTRDVLSVFGRDAMENGIADGLDRKKIILSYAGDGNPLVSDSSSDGYTNGNDGGPIRTITHLNQGACLKNVVKVIVDGDGSTITTPQERVFTSYLSGEENGLPMAGVRAIAVDDQGGAWIGTYGGGAAYIDSTGKINLYNEESSIPLPGSYVNDILIDKTEGVWFTLGGQDPENQKGFAYLKDGEVIHYTTENTDGKLLTDFVQSIEMDTNGNIWLATALGLNKFDPKTNQWNSWTKDDGLPAQSVSTIKADNRGGLWIGVYPDAIDIDNNVYSGGYAYISENGELKVYKDNDNTQFQDQWVRSFSFDPHGGVWVVKAGTYSTMENTGGRIDFVNPQGDLEVQYTGHELLPNELQDNAEIRTLTVDHKGSLWFGTTLKGVFFNKNPKEVNKKFNTESNWDSTSSQNSIFTIVVTEDTLWVGSNGGVVKAFTDDIFSKGKKQSFEDIIGHWAEKYIDYLYSKGIVNGTSSTTFSPNRGITRGEFVKLLASISDADTGEASDAGFNDVKANKWYTDYVNWSAHKGIIQGDAQGNFNPNRIINREEMATMLYRFINAMNIHIPVNTSEQIFADKDQISSWAMESIGAINGAGIINGKPGNIFDGKGLTTRAEAAKVLRELLDRI